MLIYLVLGQPIDVVYPQDLLLAIFNWRNVSLEQVGLKKKYPMSVKKKELSYSNQGEAKGRYLAIISPLICL
jgi:hypothetical protein